MRCRKCGEKLSPKEVRQYTEETELSSFHIEPICDDCWEMEKNREEVIDDFSDADSGL